MKALLLVDVQNDFLPGGALAVKEGDQIIPIINQLMNEFDLIVASKDWHPPHHVSFAIWPDHCVQGSWGAEFPSSLDTSRIAHIAYKGSDPEIDSYSAFFDQEKGRETTLYDFLLQNEVDHLYVVGLATEYCVRASILDALTLGFKVTVVLSACRGIDSVTSQKAIEEMRSLKVEFI